MIVGSSGISLVGSKRVSHSLLPFCQHKVNKLEWVDNSLEEFGLGAVELSLGTSMFSEILLIFIGLDIVEWKWKLFVFTISLIDAPIQDGC